MKRLLLLSALALLSACSQLPTHIDKAALVDQWVAQEQYRRADEILRELSSDDPQYPALERQQRALPSLIKQFEQKVLREVKGLAAQNHWVEAIAHLDEASQQLPPDTVLNKARKTLLAERKAYMVTLNLELDLLTARQLPARNAILEKMLAADPDSFWTRWKLYQQRRLGYELADVLLDCVDEAIAEQNLEEANICLEPVGTVAKGSQQQRLSLSQQRLARELQRKPDQLAQQKAKADRLQLQRLKQEYRDMIAAGWWLAAREKMNQLQVHAPADTEVVKWLGELQQIISTQVELGIQQGQALYSQGFLQQALEIWRNTAELSPDNTVLQAHIQRAERFIEKLQRLES